MDIILKEVLALNLLKSICIYKKIITLIIIFLISSTLIYGFCDTIGTWDQFIGYKKWNPNYDGDQEIIYNDIEYNGKTYVAVGIRSTVLVTDDMRKWTDLNLKAGNNEKDPNVSFELDFKKVVWNGTFFLLVPTRIWLEYGMDDYFISTDGYKWSRYNFDPKYDGMEVADMQWDGKKFVMLLYANSGCTGILPLYSTDGVKWKEGKVKLAFKYHHLSYYSMNSFATNGKLYVGVGRYNYMTSKDGLNWSASPGEIDGTLNHVIWDGKQFVAVGMAFIDLDNDDVEDDRCGVVMTSRDGEKWKIEQKFLKGEIKTIVYDGKEYRIAGDVDKRGFTTSKIKDAITFNDKMILVSNDLIHWKIEKEKNTVRGVIGSKYLNSEYFIFGEGFIKSNSLQVRLNGNLMKFSTKPKLVNKKILVPYNELLKPLGYDVEWEKKTNHLMIKKGDIECQLDSINKILKINEITYKLGQGSLLENNKLLISPEEILIPLGYNVKYEADKLRLLIEDPNYKSESTEENADVN